jgi:hypothetical protein
MHFDAFDAFWNNPIDTVDVHLPSRPGEAAILLFCYDLILSDLLFEEDAFYSSYYLLHTRLQSAKPWCAHFSGGIRTKLGTCSYFVTFE